MAVDTRTSILVMMVAALFPATSSLSPTSTPTPPFITTTPPWPTSTTIPPFITTTPPWPTWMTTPSYTTTTPPFRTTQIGCRSYDGRWLNILPGETATIGCEVCYCCYDGYGLCNYIECRMPPCVDAERPSGGCCYACPNGPNCYLPNMSILLAGEVIELDGMTCQCPYNNYQDYTSYSGNLEAVCVSSTATPTTSTEPYTTEIP